VELLAERQVTEVGMMQFAELARQILLFTTTKLLGFQKRYFERHVERAKTIFDCAGKVLIGSDESVPTVDQVVQHHDLP
jgi:hypothetical protein